jgi:hypothetical protein
VPPPVLHSSQFPELNNNADLARDVTQIVFTDLARKAVTMLEHRSVAGWLSELLPVVSADRRTVSLQATASLAERAPILDGIGAEQTQVRRTTVSGNAVLFDGQTLVLCQQIGQAGGGSGNAPGDAMSLLGAAWKRHRR